MGDWYYIKCAKGYLDGFDGDEWFEWSTCRKSAWLMSKEEAERRLADVQKVEPDAVAGKK